MGTIAPDLPDIDHNRMKEASAHSISRSSAAAAEAAAPESPQVVTGSAPKVRTQMASRIRSRLSLLDSTFLRIETPETPMHVGALQIFSIPEGASPDFVSEIVAEYRRPRPLARPFNQVLLGGPLAKIAPSTRTVDEIDVEYHVRHIALPAPGGERELGELISHLHSVSLDRTRPLWTCHVIEGLAGNRFAVYIKISHAMTDGVNGMRLVGDAMAREPDGVWRAPWQAPPRFAQPRQGRIW